MKITGGQKIYAIGAATGALITVAVSNVIGIIKMAVGHFKTLGK